jgi:glycosyltransferase involved in cell wall biosynthesis
MNELHVVVPGDVDDPALASGGNIYDRRICDGLAAAGWAVHEIRVSGSWPRPDGPAHAALAGALGAVPTGATVLLDGLVACGVPELIVPHAGRLRIAILVHLPLAAETGLDPEVAAVFDARERAALGMADAVIATSPWAARRLAERHGLDPARVHVAVPGSDPAPPAEGGDGRLLCVAAVTRRKGQDLLLDALATVKDLAWSCDCVGPVDRDPEYVTHVRRLIEVYGLYGRVRLTGPRTGGRLDSAYAAADLLVLASHAETYGMVVTEALARGIPVLATAVDAVPETLGRAPDGTTPGILVPPENPAALAAALRQWLTDPDLRRTLRARARARRDTLPSWEQTTRQLAGVLELLWERLPR